MKSLSNFGGLQKLSKEAQKNIVGGGRIKAICPPIPAECFSCESENCCVEVNGCLAYIPKH